LSLSGNKCFDIIITGENVNKGKPNPEVYLKALALLECEPDEVFVFEDSETGCEAAENAEINYIKVINYE
jgi:HAD superfamily hydrolase (TIGR01509 family)